MALRARQRGHGRKPLTHFLCIPLVTAVSRSHLQQSHRLFTEKISQYNNDAAPGAVIPIKAIRPIDTLHLTLGVMSLDNTELKSAIAHLHSIDFAALVRVVSDAKLPSGCANEESLNLRLSSLRSMHSPRKTSVLYAEPESRSVMLQALCEAVRQTFLEQGLLIHDGHALKLHATVVNTVYAKAELGRVRKLDATDLLAQMASFEWTPFFAPEELVICKMGAKEILDDAAGVVSEAYEIIAHTSIPTAS